jgi:hypothetical protein
VQNRGQEQPSIVSTVTSYVLTFVVAALAARVDPTPTIAIPATSAATI